MKRRSFLRGIAGLQGASLAATGFPVTLRHALGQTTIPRRPLRIVSLGLNDHDFLYALGVAPVGVREWWGGRPYATWSWSEAQRRALGATPAVMWGPSIDPEWVLALQPDLIVATCADIGPAEYRKLSRIAPVVARPADHPPWSAPWQAQLGLLGLACQGTTDAADRIIAAMDQRLAAWRAANPQFAGRTAAFVDIRDGQFTLWSARTATGRLLHQLGLSLPERLEALADSAGWIRLSFEHAALLDLDVAIWPESDRQAEAISTYRATRLFRESRSIWLERGSDLSAALWFQSPLSIGFALDRIVPRIATVIQAG